MKTMHFNPQKLHLKLEVVVVASALDDMYSESRLAVVSRSLLRRFSKVNMAAALMLYRIM